MDTSKMHDEFIEMRFGPKWPYVSTIRIFMQNFLSIATGDQRQADKISMAISELVENAVKYSDDNDTFLKINLYGKGDAVEVSVRNHATRAQADLLLTFLKELNSMSPLDAYMDRMKKSVGQDFSQLGLARIRYEADASLHGSYEDSIVIVSASFRIGVV